MPLDFTNDKSTLVQVRHWAITWVNVDPDLCRHIVSLGHNELMNFYPPSIIWHCTLALFWVSHSPDPWVHQPCSVNFCSGQFHVNFLVSSFSGKRIYFILILSLTNDMSLKMVCQTNYQIFTSSTMVTHWHPRRFSNDFEYIFFKHILVTDTLSISYETVLRCMPMELTAETSILGSGNAFILSGNKLLSEPMLTRQIRTPVLRIPPAVTSQAKMKNWLHECQKWVSHMIGHYAHI